MSAASEAWVYFDQLGEELQAEQPIYLQYNTEEMVSQTRTELQELVDAGDITPDEASDMFSQWRKVCGFYDS